MPKETRCKMSKYWCFTLNNFTVDQMDHLCDEFKAKDVGYIFGEEVGDQGTPHLQGYIEAAKRIRPLEYFDLPKEVHWERRKGTKLENQRYCSKDGKVHSWKIRPVRPVVVKDIYGWQKEVAALFDKQPDSRTIYWIWEPDGERGKTGLARWLCHHRGAYFMNGAKRHCLAAAFKCADVDLFVFGYPRTSEGYVSYDALESLKDGLFFSGFGVEATGMCMRNHPHILVLCNFPPDKEKLSVDRWKIGRVTGQSIKWD